MRKTIIMYSQRGPKKLKLVKKIRKINNNEMIILRSLKLYFFKKYRLKNIGINEFTNIEPILKALKPGPIIDINK